MKETETPGATPEQLLRLLEVQLAQQRAQRAAPNRSRAMFLVGAILLILFAAGAALMVLEQMLSDHRRTERPAAVEAPGNL